jgi:hypothetical protein
MKDSAAPQQVNPPDSSGLFRHEVLWLFSGLLIFFFINFFSADRAPAVWCDEVMYADPAVNLYQGHGFTSGAWYAQSLDKFWAGNVPLYPAVLFVWLKIFGFSLLTVRSFHYAMTALAVGLAWLAVRRLNLIASPAHRLIFCVVCCLSSASTFVYRSARPESLCMALMAVAFLAASIPKAILRYAILFLLGVLLVWIGLQMAAYLAILLAVACLFAPKERRGEFCALCLGCGLAIILLYFFYTKHGVWQDFVVSIRRHTVANDGQQHGVIPGYGGGLGYKIRKIPSIYFDYSFMPTLVLACWIVWARFRAQSLRLVSPIGFGLASAIIVPLGLHFAGVFPPYYFWMAFLPLAVGVCAELSALDTGDTSKLLRVSVFLLLALACALGLPRRLAVAAQDWRGRNYEPVMALAKPYVAPDKLVYSDFAAYYAAKQNAAAVILPPCITILSPEEKARVSVAIVNGDDPGPLANIFGGQWRDTGAVLTPPPPIMGVHEGLDSRQYRLHVFLRQ